MKFIRTNIDLIFLWLMSLIGVALVLSATSTYGAGLPSDSAWYISAAENLLRGKGLLQFDSSQLTAFPPLFTLLVALLSRLLNMDVFIIGWILNVLLFGVNILLSGLLIREVFSPGSVYFYLGVIFTALSPSFLRMHASILTEPLFVTLMLGSIFIARKYIIKPDIKLIWGLGALAASAALLRFVGISLIASGFLIILLGFRRNWKQTLSHGVVFGLVSGIPIASWLYFYNYRLFGAFLYPGNPRNANIKENFLQALRKIYYWFVPYRPLFKNGTEDVLIVLAGCLFILILINRKKNWIEWLRDFKKPFTAATLIYAGVYFGAITASANTGDHVSLMSDRYYAAIIFSILVILFISFDKLIKPHIPLSNKLLRVGLLLLAFLWFSIPVSRLAEYLQKSHANGEAGYNIYNTRKYHELETLNRAAKIIQDNPEANYYTNIPALVWFITRQNMLPLPDNYQNWTKDEFKAKKAGWPFDKPGYVIWFEPDPFEIFYSPKDLYLVADISPVIKTPDGTIYFVSARK